MAKDDLQPNLIALLIIMMVASLIVVILRAIAAWKLPHRKFWWDDIFAIATLPFILGSCCMLAWWVSLGLGKPAAEVPTQDLDKAALIIWADTFLYDTSITLPKISALLFYLRIFGTGNRVFRWATYFGMFMAAGWLFAVFMVDIFECTPIAAAYDVNIEGTCLAEWHIILGTAIASVIIDLYILLLPLPMLWGLQAPWKKRVQVMTVFICGYGVIAVSIGRVVSAAEAGDKLLSDPTWSDVPYCMWLIIEAPVSVISISLPTIFSYFRFLHNRGKQTSANSYSTGSKKSTAEMSSQQRSLEYSRTAFTGNPYAHSSDLSDSGPEVFPTDVVQHSAHASYHDSAQQDIHQDLAAAEAAQKSVP